jgi:hypothetical protein
MGHIFTNSFYTFKKSEATDKKVILSLILLWQLSTESGCNTPLYLGVQQYTAAKTLETWFHAEVYSVIWFLWAKHVSSTEIPCHCIRVYGERIMRLQHLRKWRKV